MTATANQNCPEVTNFGYKVTKNRKDELSRIVSEDTTLPLQRYASVVKIASISNLLK